MEFRQLEAYIKVVELGSFSKAAKELHVSQPSVSTYISTLERELDITLLNRSTKTVSTTLAGQRFLARAKELIALRSESVDAMKDLSEDHSGEIRITASSVPASYLLPKILAEFHALYPKVTLTIDQKDSAAATQAVAENKVDIGFSGSIIENPTCSFNVFTDEELIFIGSAATNTLSSTRVYTLENLLYEGNFISREVGSGTRIQYEKFFTDNNVDLKKIQSCVNMGNTQSVINSVASGLGVSIVSELAARDALAQGQIVRLRCEERIPHRKIYTVLNTRVKHSHLVKLFLDHIG
ncbi:MAG: selenium metabolism-associated LysR family transcriptional regulator [Coriobacteriia bacterium]|nr:selenium metabolism-associated LysR family transcriptional regulator [Coriobacteriia bacterium]